MSFESLLNQRFTVQRDTSALLLTTSIAASMSITYQPSELCHVTVSVSGSTVYGQCSITGTDVNDGVVSDLFTFTGADTQQGSQIFKTITGVTTSGFTGGTLSIEGIMRTGESLMVRRNVKSIYSRVYTPETTFVVSVPGEQQREISRAMFFLTESDLLKGDYLVESGGATYQIKTSLQPRRDAMSVHHYEADVKLIES